MTRETRLLGILSLLMGIIFVTGCVSQYGQPAQTTAASATSTTISISSGGVKEFTIHETNFKLTPATITVNKGDTVRIIIANDQGAHNLFIEGYNERVGIGAIGSAQTIEFVADKSGTFGMWCEVSGHKSLGMEGQLIVT